MKERKRILERIAEGSDIAGEPLPLQPLVELAGDRRVLIEQHRGVTAYSAERICVKVRYGIVAVSGHGLRLGQMTRARLVIFGRIDAVELIRKGGESK